MNRLVYLIFMSILFSQDTNSKYYDIEGNEIVFKNKKWNYIMIPDNDCTIPFKEFANYIAENSDINFLNNKEAYRYGIYKMPHMNVCPPIDFEPVIFPINAEYQIKSTWDSLKVGMKQKKVRELMKFDPIITYNKNKINYWEYYKFGILEFDNKGNLLKWKYIGRNNQLTFLPKNLDTKVVQGSKNNIFLKFKYRLRKYYDLLKGRVFNKK